MAMVICFFYFLNQKPDIILCSGFQEWIGWKSSRTRSRRAGELAWYSASASNIHQLWRHKAVGSPHNNTAVHVWDTVYTWKLNSRQYSTDHVRKTVPSQSRGREDERGGSRRRGERRSNILSRGRRFSGGLGQKSSVWPRFSPWEICSSHASPTTLPLPSLHCYPNIFTK